MACNAIIYILHLQLAKKETKERNTLQDSKLIFFFDELETIETLVDEYLTIKIFADVEGRLLSSICSTRIHI